MTNIVIGWLGLSHYMISVIISLKLNDSASRLTLHCLPRLQAICSSYFLEVFSFTYFPLVQFPSHGISAHHLYPIITEAIMQLGFRVISVTSNGAASNQKLYHMMHFDPDPVTGDCVPTPYRMPNPYTAEDPFIYFISDVPHFIKTTRNCWANSYAHSFKRRLWVIFYP